MTRMVDLFVADLLGLLPGLAACAKITLFKGGYPYQEQGRQRLEDKWAFVNQKL